MKSYHRSEFSNLSSWKEEAWKKPGLQRDSNPWPPRYRCDALPTEAWSHTLGARSICWVHMFPCSEMMWSLYEIIHICTAVVDESEEWSSQWFFFRFLQVDFFQVSSFQLLKLENSLRWSLFTFIHNRSTNMNYFIYSCFDKDGLTKALKRMRQCRLVLWTERVWRWVIEVHGVYQHEKKRHK